MLTWSPRFWSTVRINILSESGFMGFMEMVVLVEAVVVVAQIRPDVPSNIPYLSAVEVNHAPQSVCAKDDAP